MKALFKNKFPYVEKDDSELNEDELKIKRIYESQYLQKETEVNQLPEIHGYDSGVRAGSKRRGNSKSNN